MFIDLTRCEQRDVDDETGCFSFWRSAEPITLSVHHIVCIEPARKFDLGDPDVTILHVAGWQMPVYVEGEYKSVARMISSQAVLTVADITRI